MVNSFYVNLSLYLLHINILNNMVAFLKKLNGHVFFVFYFVCARSVTVSRIIFFCIIYQVMFCIGIRGKTCLLRETKRHELCIFFFLQQIYLCKIGVFSFIFLAYSSSHHRLIDLELVYCFILWLIFTMLDAT